MLFNISEDKLTQQGESKTRWTESHGRLSSCSEGSLLREGGNMLLGGGVELSTNTKHFLVVCIDQPHH